MTEKVVRTVVSLESWDEFAKQHSRGPISEVMMKVWGEMQVELERKILGDPPPPPPPLTMEDIDRLLIKYGLKKPPEPERGTLYGIVVRQPKTLIDISKAV